MSCRSCTYLSHPRVHHAAITPRFDEYLGPRVGGRTSRGHGGSLALHPGLCPHAAALPPHATARLALHLLRGGRAGGLLLQLPDAAEIGAVGGPVLDADGVALEVNPCYAGAATRVSEASEARRSGGPRRGR